MRSLVSGLWRVAVVLLVLFATCFTPVIAEEWDDFLAALDATRQAAAIAAVEGLPSSDVTEEQDAYYDLGYALYFMYMAAGESENMTPELWDMLGIAAAEATSHADRYIEGAFRRSQDVYSIEMAWELNMFSSWEEVECWCAMVNEDYDVDGIGYANDWVAFGLSIIP